MLATKHQREEIDDEDYAYNEHDLLIERRKRSKLPRVDYLHREWGKQEYACEEC